MADDRSQRSGCPPQRRPRGVYLVPHEPDDSGKSWRFRNGRRQSSADGIGGRLCRGLDQWTDTAPRWLSQPGDNPGIQHAEPGRTRGGCQARRQVPSRDLRHQWTDFGRSSQHRLVPRSEGRILPVEEASTKLRQRIARRNATRMIYFGLMVVMVAIGAVVFLGSPAQVNSQRDTTDGINIGGSDLGGVVTSTGGRAAGVWVIAETTDLPTKFAKIVVTDDKGRYVIPDLPKANYSVWVRGYGLIDSPKVKTTPGNTTNL